jgi:hypothetical protein
MIRRRRRPREIPFSLDSFLDLVANVVGIIIRLILIAWVGARSYTGLVLPSGPEPPADLPSAKDIHDPLEEELARRRQELQQAQQRLLEQLRQLPPVLEGEQAVSQELIALGSSRQALAGERAALGQTLAAQQQAVGSVMPSLGELRERGKLLAKQIADLEKLPPPKKELRYRTPVSRPMQTESLHFECRAGRVTHIDMAAFDAEIQAGLQEKGELLRNQWSLTDVTRPVGAFRVRYVVTRRREGLEALTGAPDPHGSFSWGVTRREIEPLVAVRGESLETALAPNSEFCHILDGVDARQATVTLFVYPDSFAMFRQLRDALYERGLEVAGIPIPEGIPIAFSPHGHQIRSQ